MKKHRNWCYTINNPTEEDEKKMLIVFARSTTINYFAQDEIGEKNKVPHIQGFVSFKHQRTRSAVSKDFPRARLSVMYKCILANTRYCTKEKTRAPNGRQWSFAPLQDVRPERVKVLEELENLRLEDLKRIIDNDWLDKICNGEVDDVYI